MCLLFFLKLLDVLGQQSDLDICRIRGGNRSCKYIYFASSFAAYLLLPHLEYHNYAVRSCVSSKYA